MTKYLSLVLIVLSPSLLYCQITTTKINQQVTQERATEYDSLKNFLTADFQLYIGQELYAPGIIFPEFGYDGLFIDYRKDTWLDNNNVYKSDGVHKTKYEAIAGKYFTVLDVVNNPNAYPKDFLKLQEKESKDILYYAISSLKEFDFPFVVVGYYLKLKNLMIGNQYVIRGVDWSQGARKMLEIKTGQPPINFSAGSVWKCIDVTIEDQFFDVALIIENESDEQLILPVNYLDKTWFVFPLTYSDSLKTKYGQEDWLTIVARKVSLGMTKEMCEASWGKPEKINPTITFKGRDEQWVYSDRYLYFENGVLVAIN